MEECPQCGAPVDPKSDVCDYCGAEYFVTSFASLGDLDDAGIRKYIAEYKKTLNKEPKDPETNLSMAHCYITLGHFDRAEEYVENALDLIPSHPDPYFYKALCSVGGKKPSIMSMDEVKEVENWLESAIEIGKQKGLPLVLLGIVRYEYYVKNGLKPPPPGPESLIEKGINKGWEGTEAERMLEAVNLDDDRWTALFQQQD